MINETRPLILEADGTEIASTCRMRVRGASAMNLLPNCYYVDIYNFSPYDLARLKVAKEIRMYGEDGIQLFSGELEDIYTHSESTKLITTVVVSDGKTFWSSPVSMTLGGGTTVSQTVQTLLKGVALVRYNAEDVRIPRAQTYEGRLADAISMLAKSVNARAYFDQGSVRFTGKDRAAEMGQLDADEIWKEPGYAEGVTTVRTGVRGYALGKVYSLSGSRLRLVRQTFDADNWEGLWRSELILLDERMLSASQMGGGG